MNDLYSKVVKQGGSFKDALGLSDAIVEGIYAQAYRLYNTGKYQEVTDLFRMLVILKCHGTEQYAGDRSLLPHVEGV